MTTKCFAMVRGSVIRLTRLDRYGQVVQGEQSSLVSRNVASIQINEVTDSKPPLNESDDRDKRRLYVPAQQQTIRYTCDLSFIGTDPDAVNIVSGMPVVKGPHGPIGFGELPFGEGPFGGAVDTSYTVGFDAQVRRPVAAFALEVWSKLDVSSCEDGREYGYTLFPFLKGGLLSGMAFSSGAVNFSIKGARTTRGSRWLGGPYALGLTDAGVTYRGLRSGIVRNQHWHLGLVKDAPEPTCGAQPLYDVIDGGTAAATTDDVIHGGTAADTTADIIFGGAA